MSDIREIAFRGREGPALIFRPDAYDFRYPDEFLADLMALANADIVGQRAVVLGVGPGAPGARKVSGISFEKMPDSLAIERLVEEYIEPDIEIKLLPADDQHKVAVLVIGDCESPPYLLKKSCGALLQGAGFIRRDTKNFLLSRSECARLREATQAPAKPGFSASQDIHLTFEDGSGETELTSSAETDLPSSMAARRLESAIQSRSEVDAMGGADTGIVRLMHVRAFGLDEPFSKKTVDELKDELRAVRRTFELEDKFHRFERTSQRLNLLLRNDGGTVLSGAKLTLQIKRENGIDIAPAVYALSVNAISRRRELTEVTTTGYPSVRIGPAYYEVSYRVGPVDGHSSSQVFSEPLRLALSEAGAGKLIAIYYELEPDSGGDTAKGLLRLRIGAAAPGHGGRV